MNCEVCTKALLPSRAVFRCSCGAITHAYCWEKHIIQLHKPCYTIGYIGLNEKFTPKGEVSKAGKRSAEKDLVTAEKPTERNADAQCVGSNASLKTLEQILQSSNENGYKLETKVG